MSAAPAYAQNHNPMWDELDEELDRDRPKPELVKAAKPKAQVLEAEEEIPLGPCPEPPDWMSFEAKCEWLRSAPSFWERGKLVGSIVSLLEAYCATIGLLREAEAMLQADGMIVKGRPHPAFQMMMNAARESRGLAVELRLNREDHNGEGGDEDEKKLERNWRNKGLLA